MNIILKDDIPVCQRARRLSCSEKLQVNDQIDDWLQQASTPNHPPLHLWSVNIVGSQCSGDSSSPGSGNGRKRVIVLNRRPELKRGKTMRSTKEELVKKVVLMPDGSDKNQDSKINVFLLNLPDVEEVPSHDGETFQFSRIMLC
ncbi:hypothetical protein TNCV_1077001 [Trichonephila clavipes]|uniref:Uncharacterized protein n=1 Tax=Trichonephila clavipes TaxID=2585209 RepID=A0A8X6RR53_TRICX|nr:hypothetical protein TNCV_1077001 [Trichonephila clavipes]